MPVQDNTVTNAGGNQGKPPAAPAEAAAHELEDSSVTQARRTAAITAYRYNAFSREHAQRTFWQQYAMSWIIFVVVLVVVGVGLWFSWQQFRQGMAHANALASIAAGGRSGLTVRKTQTAASTDEEMQRADTSVAVTELELGPTGIKITSPVLGVVILGLSLGFFYLYLKYVYPITNISA
jgi:cation transport ATPase